MKEIYLILTILMFQSCYELPAPKTDYAKENESLFSELAKDDIIEKYYIDMNVLFVLVDESLNFDKNKYASSLCQFVDETASGNVTSVYIVPSDKPSEVLGRCDCEPFKEFHNTES